MKEKGIMLIKKNFFPACLSLTVVTYQAILYFLAKFTPFPSHVIGSSLDAKIPFVSIFIVPYVLWYLFLVVVPCLLYQCNKKYFYEYLLANVLVDTVGTLIFIFYPTLLIRPELVVSDFFTWLTNLIYIGDTPALNCFPSIHCANCFTAIFFMIISKDLKTKYKVGVIMSGVLIILATLFVKQHALIDVLGAFFLSLIMVVVSKFFKLSTYLEEKIEKRKEKIFS